MINNSAIDKWNRLRTKNLNQQFMNEVITGLNCSPFEAGAILDAVHKVFGSYFETGGSLQSGQILFQVVLLPQKLGQQVKTKKSIKFVVMKRRKFTSKFKTRVVLSSLKERQSLSELKVENDFFKKTYRKLGKPTPENGQQK